MRAQASPRARSISAASASLALARLAEIRHAAREGAFGEAERAVDQIAEHVGEILVGVGGETATVKSVSAVSGAFAISHQRQRSAGSSSSAASVKMPRRELVENLPPW